MSNFKIYLVVVLLVALTPRFLMGTDKPTISNGFTQQYEVVLDTINPQLSVDKLFLDQWVEYQQNRQERSLHVMYLGRKLFVEYSYEYGSYQIYDANNGHIYTGRFAPTIEELEKQLMGINFQYYTLD